MAGNVNFNNLLTTTLESRTGELADNVTKNNALLYKLKERGNIRPISGGSKIVEELEYGEAGMERKSRIFRRHRTWRWFCMRTLRVWKRTLRNSES